MFMQRTLAKWMQMMVDHRHRHFTLLFPLPGRKHSKIFACFLASHYGGFGSDAIYWEWLFLTIPFHEVPQTPCSILPCLIFIALWSLVTVLLLTGWLSLPLACKHHESWGLTSLIHHAISNAQNHARCTVGMHEYPIGEQMSKWNAHIFVVKEKIT